MKDQRGWCVFLMGVCVFFGHHVEAAIFCVCGIILNEMRGQREQAEAKKCAPY